MLEAGPLLLHIYLFLVSKRFWFVSENEAEKETLGVGGGNYTLSSLFLSLNKTMLHI